MSDETPTIAPALTPEEWTELRVRFPHAGGYSDWNEGGYYVAGGDVVYELEVEGCDRDMRIDRPHALAALCLHGMPFGFTHIDVARLRHVAAVLRQAPTLDWYESASALDGLAARIAALLPPEG